MGKGDDESLSIKLARIDENVKAMKFRLDNIQCPAPRCYAHEERVGRLEDHEKIVIGTMGFLIPVIISIVGRIIGAW